MSIDPTARPARTRTRRRRAARLLLVIAATTYRLWPHTYDPTLDSEERHIFQDAGGRVFSVYEQDLDMDEARRLLAADRPLPGRRWHCEACRAGDCDHVAALVDIGLL